MEEGLTPGPRMARRAAIGALAIVLMTAGAVSAAGLLEIRRIQGFFPEKLALPADTPVDRPDPGKPQTIMVLGTDGRLGADAGSGQRSDTLLLARLDPGKRAISLMSIPRDLKVTIPGSYATDKINAAFSTGGAPLTVKTVKALLSRPGQPFKVNHVVQVNFTGFRRMVDYLGCAFVDIDRDYFNDVGGPGGYATIDIDPGYQKLCGSDALDYVRYRHGDTDLVRAARQQDFIRQTLRQPDVRRRLTFSKRTELAKIAGRYVSTDPGLGRSPKQILSLLKIGLGVAEKPVQQVPFGAGQVSYEGQYVTVAPEAIATTVDRFLDPRTIVPRTKPPKPKDASSLVDVSATGKRRAIAMGGEDIGLRLYFPALGEATGSYAGPTRVYRVHGRPAYRMVVKLGEGELGSYYGIQGLKWRRPPILSGPHETVVVDRRPLRVYYDGKKVRLVAWMTPNAVYYVSNTLGRTLSRPQLLAIARSLTRVH